MVVNALVWLKPPQEGEIAHWQRLKTNKGTHHAY
jgi:hypothetical protein